MSKQIDFMSAYEGNIIFWSGEKLIASCSNQKQVANLLSNYDISCNCLHSSSMDFATEAGFANDEDAWELWESGIAAWQGKSQQAAS